MVEQPQQPAKNPIIESVRNIIGAINLAIVLTCVGSMVAAAIYLIFFENYLKSMGFTIFAAGMKYLFTIKRVG